MRNSDLAEKRRAKRIQDNKQMRKPLFVEVIVDAKNASHLFTVGRSYDPLETDS